jgi:hypothetical protein
MASTLQLSPDERLKRRDDLVIRPLPEINMCMVYRPRPARIITLNPSSWMLLEICNGSTVREIEDAYSQILAEKGRTTEVNAVRQGLQELADFSLIRVCGERGG